MDTQYTLNEFNESGTLVFCISNEITKLILISEYRYTQGELKIAPATHLSVQNSFINTYESLATNKTLWDWIHCEVVKWRV